MTIGELKKYISDNNLPDDMPIGILDLTTDDTNDANYPFNEEVLMVDDYYNIDEFEEADYEPKGKMLFITFENKLNENPI